MVTTLGPAYGSPMTMQEFFAQPSGYPTRSELADYAPVADYAPDGLPEPEPEQAPAPQRRSREKVEQARAAIRSATGLDVDLGERDAPTLYVPREPAQPAHAPEIQPEPPAEPEGGSRAYVVREGNWRERLGLPRNRTTVPPSRTPEARRQRNISQKAERLGISHADAERMTPARR